MKLKKSPLSKVPVSKVMEAAKQVAGTSNADVQVDVFVDLSVPSLAIEAIRDLFAPATDKGHVRVEGFDDVACTPSADADLTVVVAGASRAVSRIVAEAMVAEVPVVVCAFDAKQVYERTQDTSFPLEPTDLVDMDAAHAFAGLGDALAAWIVDHCEKSRRSLASAFAFIRETLAHEYVQRTSLACSAVAAVPFIPGADLPVLTVMQARMVMQIAAAYGQTFGAQAVLEVAAALPAAFGGRAIARSLGKRAPKLAWATRGLVAFGITQLLGQAMAAYFRRGGLPEGAREAIDGLGRRFAGGDGKLAGIIRKAIGADAGDESADAAAERPEAGDSDALAAMGIDPADVGLAAAFGAEA